MKKTTMTVLAMVFMLAAGGLLLAQDQPCPELFKQAEELWLKHDYDGSSKLLEQAKKVCPNNAEILWRQARDTYDRIEDTPRDKKPDKKALIELYRGIEAVADKCAQLEPQNGECYFWKGVGMGRRGTTQGILSSLGEAKDLEATLLKAEGLKPQYHSANGAANTLGDIYNALGQYYRVVPEWLCNFPFKQAIGTCGDLNKSVDYNRKAIAREPKRIEYQKELGVSLICRGQKKDSAADVTEGKKVLTDLQALPDVKKTDPIDKQHAKEIIENQKLACGYSRDAQQEQSQEAYKK